MPGDASIFVAGHRGLVGHAILRRLKQAGHERILTAGREELDLRDQSAVTSWFRANQPDYVFLAAGTVGGILANTTRPAELPSELPPAESSSTCRGCTPLGWRHRIDLREGLERTYDWYRRQPVAAPIHPP
jgi:nucleoside-diphosphate-sugar epimerase